MERRMVCRSAPKVALFVACSAAGVLCATVALEALAPAPIDEVTLESQFDALIQASDLRDWMKVLAAQPNHVGSPHDKANADQIVTWLKGWGWDTHIETFWVLYPT